MTDLAAVQDIFEAINHATLLGRGGDVEKVRVVTEKYLGPDTYVCTNNPVAGWGRLEKPVQSPDKMAVAALRLYVLEQFKTTGGKARVDLELAHMPDSAVEAVTDVGMIEVIGAAGLP